MPSSPDGATLLYLIRHGATEANERRPYILQGCGIDLSLSTLGRRQAAAVAEFMSRRPLAGIYTSTMQRAVETAEAIASRHPLAVEAVDGLTECNVGLWEGKDWDTVIREHPQEYRAFVDNPAESPYLGGESYGDVLRRVEPTLAELMQRHIGAAFAVVAHNVVNRAYLGHLLGLDMRQARLLEQTNTGVNVVGCRDGKSSVLTMNAHFHLEGVD